MKKFVEDLLNQNNDYGADESEEKHQFNKLENIQVIKDKNFQSSLCDYEIHNLSNDPNELFNLEDHKNYLEPIDDDDNTNLPQNTDTDEDFDLENIDPRVYAYSNSDEEDEDSSIYSNSDGDILNKVNNQFKIWNWNNKEKSGIYYSDPHIPSYSSNNEYTPSSSLSSTSTVTDDERRQKKKHHHITNSLYDKMRLFNKNNYACRQKYIESVETLISQNEPSQNPEALKQELKEKNTLILHELIVEFMIPFSLPSNQIPDSYLNSISKISKISKILIKNEKENLTSTNEIKKVSPATNKPKKVSPATKIANILFAQFYQYYNKTNNELYPYLQKTSEDPTKKFGNKSEIKEARKRLYRLYKKISAEHFGEELKKRLTKHDKARLKNRHNQRKKNVQIKNPLKQLINAAAAVVTKNIRLPF